MTKTRPLLTISLLISNRIETIPRCLDSLRPIMEAISCELILTDTSKNQEVRNLLLQYTDKVYEFDWCNDFAKARNIGLQKACGEWFMFLDDDEWFSDASALIEFFQSGEYKEYGYANYQLRNFKDSQYIYYDDCWLARLFRIEENSHFVRKIHEQFVPLNGKEKYIPALVFHSGYIYDTLEDRKKHFERNQKLLLDMIKEEPDNIYWWLQLAQEYSYADEQERLISYSKECLQKLCGIDTPYVNNQRGAFYTGVVLGCIRQRRYEECAEFAKKALADKNIGKVLEAMMHLRLGEAYLFLDKLEGAKEEVLKYLNIAEKIDLNNLEIMEQLSVFLAGEAFNKNSYEIAYAILICCDLKQGSTEVLKKYYNKLGWSNKVVYTIGRIEEFIISAMWELPYESIFAEILIDVLNKDNLRKAFLKEILRQKDDRKTDFLRVIYELANSLQMIIDGLKENILDYYECLQGYVHVTSVWCDFLEAENLLEYIENETPSYIQAAIYISEYLELESKDTVAALGKLKYAVDEFPELAKGIGSFFEHYNELDELRAVQKNNEMEMLRVQIIAQVKAMLAAGQIEATKQIVAQLKKMFPEDKDVDALMHL